MPMSDLSRATAVPGGAPPTPAGGTQQHPSTFAPATFVFLVILCLFGAVIGVQLILQLGITPNTSIIGALVAMLLARLPGAIFARYRSIHVQNLAQSAISAATFGAANSLLLPIGVPFLLGRPDLILPMLVGAALSMLLDGYLLYRMFDTRVFPASGTWPPGVAAAEAIRAGDAGGRRAALLVVGLLIGIAGSWFKIPMSAFWRRVYRQCLGVDDVRHRPLDPRLCDAGRRHRYCEALCAAWRDGWRRSRRADPGRIVDCAA